MSKTTKQVIQSMHRRYAGDTKYPTPDNAKWDLYISTLDDLQHEWATDPDQKWESCLNPNKTIATMSSAQTYSLPTSVHALADYVFVDTLEGQTIRFNVIKPRDRHSKSGVYVYGSNPKRLAFTNKINTSLVGGTLRAGCYLIPDPLKSPNAFVSVDRPEWLEYRGAAQLALNDPAKEDKWGDLIGLANEEYQKMVTENNGLPAEQEDVIDVEGIPDMGIE